MATIISRNRKTVETLKSINNDSLHIKEREKTLADGTTKHVCFFTCGDVVGYVSPNAMDAIKDGAKAADLQYAECSTDDGETWIPCIMKNGGVKDSYTL